MDESAPPSGRVTGLMDLTSGQQEQLRSLIEGELRQALDTTDAATAGEFVADRRRVLEQLARGPVHDPQDPLDQNGHGRGVTEQR